MVIKMVVGQARRFEMVIGQAQRFEMVVGQAQRFEIVVGQAQRFEMMVGQAQRYCHIRKSKEQRVASNRGSSTKQDDLPTAPCKWPLSCTMLPAPAPWSPSDSLSVGCVSTPKTTPLLKPQPHPFLPFALHLLAPCHNLYPSLPLPLHLLASHPRCGWA